MPKLTREQAEAVKERIGPTMGYVVRLRERMDQVGLRPNTYRVFVDGQLTEMHRGY